MFSFKRFFPFIRYRGGYLILAFTVWLTAAYFVLKKIKQTGKPLPFSVDSVTVARLDSLERIYDSLSRPKIYPFNPGYLSDYRAYILGIDTVALYRIRNYIKKGGRFKSKRHFKQISGISDSLFEVLKPYIKINYYEKRNSNNTYKINSKSNDFIVKKDINTATAEDLKKIYGIGEVLSNRIVKYREKIGGFTIREQLKDVYALSPEAYENLWKAFEIKTPKKIELQIDLNRADMQELQKNPYIDFDLAEKIVEYRSLRGKFKDFEELKKIEGFPLEKYERIILYLRLN
jgi:competence ComEA-like helix-hairpin-helix protein